MASNAVSPPRDAKACNGAEIGRVGAVLRHAAGLQHLLRVFIRKEETGVIDYQEELEQYKERIDELATQKRYAELRDCARIS